MPNRGQPISEELHRRIQRVLDAGLTHQEFVCLIAEGRVTNGNVGNALRGDPILVRTRRALELCCEAWERSRGLSPVVGGEPRPAPLPAVYRPPEPRRGIAHAVGLPLVVGQLRQLETMVMTWDSPRRNHVLALINAARVEAER